MRINNESLYYTKYSKESNQSNCRLLVVGEFRKSWHFAFLYWRRRCGSRANNRLAAGATCSTYRKNIRTMQASRSWEPSCCSSSLRSKANKRNWWTGNPPKKYLGEFLSCLAEEFVLRRHLRSRVWVACSVICSPESETTRCTCWSGSFVSR